MPFHGSRNTYLLLTVLLLFLLVCLLPKNVRSDHAPTRAARGAPQTAFAAPVGQTCLPFYGPQQHTMRINESGPAEYEPNLYAFEFSGDGLADILITRVTFQTTLTYTLDILSNGGLGGLKVSTTAVFQGPVPAVQNPREVIVADFNGDGRDDFFIADHGYDAPPFPGYQNTLVLTAPNGHLQDATTNLPALNNFTHSACAADIDGDTDIDLYIGDIWGENDIDPHILINDGSGDFTIGINRLPALVDLNQNGYTTCLFTDVNNDHSPDLVLGDAGDNINNPHSTSSSEILLNNGSGVFALLQNALPSKLEATDIAHDIEPLNLNGDAFIDLVIVYELQVNRGSYIQTLVNNQDGTFRDETQTRMEATPRQVWIYRLEPRDLDQDGDLDLLAVHNDIYEPDPLLFLNDGDGHFSYKAHPFGLTYIYFTLIDLDGDNGQDIVMATFAPPEDLYVIRDLGCPMFLPLLTGQ